MTVSSPIGIIAAMGIEADALRNELKFTKTTAVSGITFTEGMLCDTPVVLAVCGVGKVFAALCAQTMILLFHPRMILNTGVAGALDPSLSVCDIVVASSLVQHDMNTTAIGDPPGMISGINRIHFPTDGEYSALLSEAVKMSGYHTVTGVVASADLFVTREKHKSSIREKFGAVACEMEGAAIAQVCFVNNIPCLVMRAISDSGDGSAPMSYAEFAPLAAAHSEKCLLRFLEELKRKEFP